MMLVRFGVLFLFVTIVQAAKDPCGKNCHHLVTGRHGVADSAITVSTAHNFHHEAGQARLNNKKSSSGHGAWCGLKAKAGDWIQVMFGNKKKIYKVQTQGHPESASFISQYQLSTSEDCQTYTEYRENGTVRIFTGNSDQKTIKTNTLRKSVVAKCVRLNVLKFSKFPCLRFDLMGIQECPSGFTLGPSSCYKVIEENLYWSGAAAFCRWHGGDLVTINNAGEQDWTQKNLFSETKYVTFVNKECQGATIGHLFGLTEKDCMDYCNKIPLCKGFVTKASTLECWWKKSCSENQLIKASGKKTHLVKQLGKLWINLNRVTDQQTWLTGPETPAKFYNWANGYPKAPGNCATLSPAHKFKWTTQACMSPRPFICEI